jgi:hypothetical protein
MPDHEIIVGDCLDVMPASIPAAPAWSFRILRTISGWIMATTTTTG